MSQLTHTDNIIELKNVSFSYGQDDVIHNVSLAIHKGDYLGIVGPNGGGKSTLLKLMLGLLKPQQGEVHLFHTPLSSFHQWQKIGYVSQQVTHVDAHFPMTVFDVVSMGRYPKRRFWQRLTQEDRQKVQESLSHVGMEDFSHSLIGDLSGGQRQRVFIARALATEPEVIVLDEPTVGVDVKTQKQFYSLLQKLHTKHNLTLVLVSHELDIVAHEATEIAYVNRTIDYHGIPQPFLDSEYFEQLSGKGEHSHA